MISASFPTLPGPAQSIIRRHSSCVGSPVPPPTVATIRDGKVKQTRVKIGTRRDGRVEIVDGLAGDDTVVTAGHLKIRDGVPVTIVNADANKGV